MSPFLSYTQGLHQKPGLVVQTTDASFFGLFMTRTLVNGAFALSTTMGVLEKDFI